MPSPRDTLYTQFHDRDTALSLERKDNLVSEKFLSAKFANRVNENASASCHKKKDNATSWSVSSTLRE